MATLQELLKRGELIPVQIRLRDRHEYEERKMYGTPRFLEWLNGPVKGLHPLDPTNQPPRHQAFALLKSYITGGEMVRPRMFHIMEPRKPSVYELKTPDLRFFGWFYRPNVFIAVLGDNIEKIKGSNLYLGYREEVVRFREELDLDEPKFLIDKTEEDLTNV